MPASPLPRGRQKRRKKKKPSKLKRLIAQDRLIRWTEAQRQALIQVEKLQKSILHKHKHVYALVEKYSEEAARAAAIEKEAATASTSNAQQHSDAVRNASDSNQDGIESDESDDDLFAAAAAENVKGRPSTVVDAKVAAAQTRALIHKHAVDISNAEKKVEQLMRDFQLHEAMIAPVDASAPDGVTSNVVEEVTSSTSSAEAKGSDSEPTKQESASNGDDSHGTTQMQVKGDEEKQFRCVAAAGGVLFRTSAQMSDIVSAARCLVQRNL